jgi:hypothetical protein
MILPSRSDHQLFVCGFGPQVHRPAFWDSLFDQPMLVVDDSVGRYAGWRHTGAEDTTQQLLMAAGPRSPMAQAAAAARGAAGSDALKVGRRAAFIHELANQWFWTSWLSILSHSNADLYIVHQ